MLDRIMGVITLKPPTYRQIADDTTATSQAAIIVVVMSLIGGIIGGLLVQVVGSSLPPEATAGIPATNPIAYAIRTVILAIIGWLIGGFVFAFVSTTFFGGRTNSGEMLRVFGYTQVFQILSLIPCIGPFLALILSVIGAIIGIREASEFDTTKAILTGIVGLVVLIIVNLVVGAILGVVGL